MSRLLPKAAILATGLFTTACAFSEALQDADDSSVRGAIFAGIGVVQFDTTYKLTETGSNLPVYIGLEGDLNLPTTNHVDTIGGMVRFAKRHKITAGYFHIDRKSTLFSDNITYKGEDYGYFDLSVRDKTQFIDLTYAYEFFNDGHNAIDFSAGIFTLDMNVTLDAEAELAVQGNTERVEFSDGIDVLAPLPMFGISVVDKITDKWALSAKVSAIYGKYEDVEANVLRTKLLANYAITDSFGIAAGISYFDGDINIDETEVSQEIDYGYKGLHIGIDYLF